jgi:hypothetical protein
MDDIGALEGELTGGGVLDLALVGAWTAGGVGVASPDAAITGLLVVERVRSRLLALEAELMVVAASPQPLVASFTVLEPDDDRERTIRIADAVREEVGAALRLSGSVAQDRIDAARLLCGPLAATGAALRAGAITPAHAGVVVEAARRLPGRWADPDDPAQEQDREVFAEACGRLQGACQVFCVRGGGFIRGEAFRGRRWRRR